MDVFVTILALSLRNLENCVLALRALWQMAFVAHDRRMFALEWILGCRVILHRERGRLKPIHCVACCALSSIALAKLPFVRLFVAVHALRKRYRRFEITVGMTSTTLDSLVFPKQRIFCFRVIKIL